MKYALEDVIEVKEELEPIIHEHWQEIAVNKDKIKLNPDWKQYEALQKVGLLKLYTARENGKLVGYFCVTLFRAIHYADHYFASCDVIYIKPEYRKGSTGAKLIRYVEQELQKYDISVLFINTKVHAPFDPLLQKLGYTNSERLYQKYIGS